MINQTPKSGIQSRKSFDLTADLVDAAREAALPFDVCPTLSEVDQLLGYTVKHGSRGTKAAREYIVDGHNHAKQVLNLIDQLSLQRGRSRVLEFAAGFGRITRHLKKLAPDLHLSASDIHTDACHFLETEIGIPAFVSSLTPDGLNVGKDYDLIFVVSLFSHLPANRFGSWLKALHDCLAPGGYLMFTTHGQSARKMQPAFWDSLLDPNEPGYGYHGQSDQEDIVSSEYGTTIALPRFVTKVIHEQMPTAQLVSFQGGAWFTIQDEWILRRAD